MNKASNYAMSLRGHLWPWQSVSLKTTVFTLNSHIIETFLERIPTSGLRPPRNDMTFRQPIPLLKRWIQVEANRPINRNLSNCFPLPKSPVLGGFFGYEQGFILRNVIARPLVAVAIRILKALRFIPNSHIIETFRGTDSHVGLTPLLGMTWLFGRLFLY